MFPMDPSAYPGIAFANPDAATALATMALVDVTNNLVIVGLIIGLGQIAAIVYGIWSMNQSGKRRAKEHDERHAQTMEQLRQSMKALEALIRHTRPTRRAVLRP
ncbi:MAG: hypothetical protein OXE57_13980, partial [Alphaproteobacteria bacterium]|nr:hypothetical protein [Alphaproteobacteria bacterium]